MTTVSIILPTLNGEQRIRTAIDSVLAQTYRDWELLVISDGSTDQTKSIVEQYAQQDNRIVFIENEKTIGIQQTLNKGVVLAKGTYIARIDDDDVWIDTTKLAKQVAYLEAHPGCVLVGTSAVIRDEHGQELGSYVVAMTDAALRARMLFKNPFLHPTIVMRKTAVDQVGGYDQSEQVKHIEDYALWLRLGQIGTLANLSDRAVALTIHTSSVTFQNRIVQTKRLRTLIRQYRTLYPNFFWAAFILWVRLAGFTTIHYLPIPQKFLYWIQRTYKRL